MLDKARPVWQGQPSQFMNINAFSVCLTISVWLIYEYWQTNINMVLLASLPCLYATYRYYSTAVMRYTLTEEELIYSYGLFSPQEQPIELYKILDRVPQKPWYMRMFNLGNIVLETMDETTPRLKMQAIYDPMPVSAVIRHHSERMKEQRGFRTFNIQNAN